MQYNKVFIFGIGGHARVLLSEILQIDNSILVIFVASSEYENQEITINNKSYPVINNYSDLETQYDDLSCGIVGIGAIEKRISVVKEINEILPSFNWMTMISKNSIVAKDVVIKEGTVVIAGCIINTGTQIGKHCIVNTKASIDHDNIIGDYINISPTVVTGGCVKIGDYSDVGIGSTIINNINIDHDVVIGGHSFINRDCISNSMYLGTPAKKIK
jgi:sugar O-acyltransferase (sialic acid O-acetyltransferase NeuD family)